MKNSLKQERLRNIKSYVESHKDLIKEKQNELDKLADKVQAISETLKLYGDKAFIYNNRISSLVANKESTDVEFYRPSGNGDYFVALPYFVSVYGEKVYAFQSVEIRDLAGDPDAYDTIPIPENLSWKDAAKNIGYSENVIKVIANSLKKMAISKLNELKESNNLIDEEISDIESYLEELSQ